MACEAGDKKLIAFYARLVIFFLLLFYCVFYLFLFYKKSLSWGRIA